PPDPPNLELAIKLHAIASQRANLFDTPAHVSGQSNCMRQFHIAIGFGPLPEARNIMYVEAPARLACSICLALVRLDRAAQKRRCAFSTDLLVCDHPQPV